MEQPSTDADLARQRGRETGAASDGFAGSCPYKHSEMDLRDAWFTGFGEGRADLRAQAQAERDAAS